jgi:hypothetical protein
VVSHAPSGRARLLRKVSRRPMKHAGRRSLCTAKREYCCYEAGLKVGIRREAARGRSAGVSARRVRAWFEGACVRAPVPEALPVWARTAERPRRSRAEACTGGSLLRPTESFSALPHPGSVKRPAPNRRRGRKRRESVWRWRRRRAPQGRAAPRRPPCATGQLFAPLCLAFRPKPPSFPHEESEKQTIAPRHLLIKPHAFLCPALLGRVGREGRNPRPLFRVFFEEKDMGTRTSHSAFNVDTPLDAPIEWLA